MAKGKRKVTVEHRKQSNKGSTPPRRPSVFERLGPGSAGISPSNRKSGNSNEPRDKGRNWQRVGESQFGSSGRYQHGAATASSSKRNKKKNKDKVDDLRSKVSNRPVDTVEHKEENGPPSSPKQRKRSRSASRKREPETKIKSQVVVTNRKSPAASRAEDRGSGQVAEEWEAESAERGDWRMDRCQLDFEEELTLEKKRQQLQRELELEMQKERLLKHGHENVIIQKQISATSSSSTSTSSSSSSSTSSSSSDGEDDSSSSSTSHSSSSTKKNSSTRKSKKGNRSISSSSSDGHSKQARKISDDNKPPRREDRNQRNKPHLPPRDQGRNNKPDPKKRQSPPAVGTSCKGHSSALDLPSSANKSKQRQISTVEKGGDKHHKKKRSSSTTLVPQDSVTLKGRDRLTSPARTQAVTDNRSGSKSTSRKRQSAASTSPLYKDRKKLQSGANANSLPRSEGRKGSDGSSRQRSRSPKKDGGQIRYSSPDNAKESGGRDDHQRPSSRSRSRDQRSQKRPPSPSPPPSSISAGRSMIEKSEGASRKSKHQQNVSGKVLPPASSPATTKKSKERGHDKDRETERSGKDYGERPGRRSPNPMNDAKRLPPGHPRQSPPPRPPPPPPPPPPVPSGRSDKHSRDSQWIHGLVPDPHDAWASTHADRGRTMDGRGPQSPTRKDQEVSRRMKYEEPSHLLSTRHQLHEANNERSRDGGRHPPELLDERHNRRESQGRPLNESRRLTCTNSKSPEPRGMPEERSGRGRIPDRDRRARHPEEHLPHLMQSGSDRRHPLSPETKYGRNLTPPPLPSPPHIHVLQQQQTQGRYPSPLDWQPDRGRSRAVQPYSPERRKGLPPSPTRREPRFDHREFEEPLDLYDFGRRERERVSRDHPVPPVVGRHAVEKTLRDDRYPAYRGVPEPLDIYEREALPRSRQPQQLPPPPPPQPPPPPPLPQPDYGHDGQRNPDYGRHSEKWDHRRDIRDQRILPRNEPPDHAQLHREPHLRRREDELPPNVRKRARDEPVERPPLPKRRKGSSPPVGPGPRDYPQDGDAQWGRGLSNVETNRRSGGPKGHASVDSSLPLNKGNTRDRPPRSAGNQSKDQKSQPRGRNEGNSVPDSSRKPTSKSVREAAKELQAKLQACQGKRKRPSSQENDDRLDKKKKPNSTSESQPVRPLPSGSVSGSTATSKDEKKMKPAGTPSGPRRRPPLPPPPPTSLPPPLPVPLKQSSDDSTPAKLVSEVETPSNKGAAEKPVKPAMTNPENRSASFSDWSDDSLDILNQNTSPEVKVVVVSGEQAEKAKPDSETKTDDTSSVAAESSVKPSAPLEQLSNADDEKQEKVKSLPVTMELKRHHKSRSEGGDDSRGSFDDAIGRGRSRDRNKTKERSGRSSHPSSRHTSLERLHHHEQELIRSKPSTPIPLMSVNVHSLEKHVECAKEDRSQSRVTTAPVDTNRRENVPDGKGPPLESYEYDPISDDELEALLEDPEDKDGVKGVDSAANKPGIIDILEVDWASLMGNKLNRPETSPKNALQNFSPARVLARIGVSVRWAGNDLMKRVETCFEKQSKSERASVSPSNENDQHGEDSQDAVNRASKANEPKYHLENDVAALHTVILRQKHEREAILDNIGPYRQALCARRDLLMRRKLCRLQIKSQDNSSTFTSSNMDTEMFRLSLQLFQQRKSDLNEPSIPSMVSCQ